MAHEVTVRLDEERIHEAQDLLTEYQDSTWVVRHSLLRVIEDEDDKAMIVHLCRRVMDLVTRLDVESEWKELKRVHMSLTEEKLDTVEALDTMVYEFYYTYTLPLSTLQATIQLLYGEYHYERGISIEGVYTIGMALHNLVLLMNEILPLLTIARSWEVLEDPDLIKWSLSRCL